MEKLSVSVVLENNGLDAQELEIRNGRIVRSNDPAVLYGARVLNASLEPGDYIAIRDSSISAVRLLDAPVARVEQLSPRIAVGPVDI